MMDAAFEAQVRQRAYEIWVDLGRADGEAQDHWIAAERDLSVPPAKPKTARAALSKAKTAAPKTQPLKTAKASAAKLAGPKAIAAAKPSRASV